MYHKIKLATKIFNASDVCITPKNVGFGLSYLRGLSVLRQLKSWNDILIFFYEKSILLNVYC